MLRNHMLDIAARVGLGMLRHLWRGACHGELIALNLPLSGPRLMIND